ncbi:hypothetical protein BRADI_1g45660v3 [Brachypodium distachyon]|uniref:LMBR1-like membrane protein n=2 Tax=Brachypodium distachyon TaxID=15368 RepID=A0A0Q3K3J6_BRADI|nr:hypothetical protein BRADI_1g45660v3 [Brachypodium distachyon]
MWVFYLIALPLTVGLVAATLRYFAGPAVPLYVLATVGYAWLCSLSFVILVPTDIYTTITGNQKSDVGFFWSWSYWSTFTLGWAIIPTIKGYEDAGDFTVKERLKTSIRANMLFYEIVGVIGFLGIIMLIIIHHDWRGAILGFAMACSNTFGLVTGAFLLGFGLSEIPRNVWKNADWTRRQKNLSRTVAMMAVKLEYAHQEYCNAIAVVQATSKQMSKRDPVRPYMDIIDNMLAQMLRDDPLFNLCGGKLEENDMDYDTDGKTMAALRRRLRRAHEEYCRCKRKYVSGFRENRPGTLGSFLDFTEFIWRCILRRQLLRVLAVILGCISAAILLAEATLLPTGVHLSLFSILINTAGKKEVLVQVVAFAPLMYMCVCTYYPLFRLGMMVVYSLTPGHTSSVSLLMICSMVARYAPPISYNFLNLIHLGGDAKTTFEKGKEIVIKNYLGHDNCSRNIYSTSLSPVSGNSTKKKPHPLSSTKQTRSFHAYHFCPIRGWGALMMLFLSLGETSTESIHSLWLFILCWSPVISLGIFLSSLEAGKGSSSGLRKKKIWMGLIHLE